MVLHKAIPANTVVAGSGSTSLLTGYFKGIVTQVDTTKRKYLLRY